LKYDELCWAGGDFGCNWDLSWPSACYSLELERIVVVSNEKIRVMHEQLKIMKANVSKTKQLGIALAKSKELVTKLKIDLDEHVSSISTKCMENDTLSIRVVALKKVVVYAKVKFDNSSQFIVKKAKSKSAKEEKKSVKDKLTSTNVELVNLKQTVAKLESELQDKDKAKSDLIFELEEVKNLIVANHWESFKKAQHHVVVLLPNFDYKKLNVNCDVVDEEIVRESQPYSNEEEEEKNEVDSTMAS